MFTRQIVINPNNLTLLVQYSSPIVEKDSQITIDFQFPSSDTVFGSLQVNQALLGQIVQLCRMHCQHNDMLDIEFQFLFNEINHLVKGNLTQAA